MLGFRRSPVEAVRDSALEDGLVEHVAADFPGIIQLLVDEGAGIQDANGTTPEGTSVGMERP
jgi:hypothetical protein